MKKILIILIISLVFVLPVMADDFDDDFDFYSYSSVNTGYGAIIQDGKLINTIDVGFSYNFASMNDFRTLGIGLGSRFDALFGVGNKTPKNYIDCSFLLGPFFHIVINRAIALNLTAGPLFGFYKDGNTRDDEHFTIGPAIDASITLTPQSFNSISFSFGTLAAVNFGFASEPVMYSVVPYVSFNMVFSNSYIPYNSLIIY